MAAADGSVRVIEDTARLLDGCSLLKRLINLRDDEGRTPLYQAAAGGHPSVCKLLLDRNADALVGPKLLDPALVALAAAPADLVVQRSAGSLQSKAPTAGDYFHDSPIGNFVAGIPSAAVSQGRYAMFEVEVSKLRVGAKSSLVVGWSTNRNRKPTFDAHLGHAPGSLGVTLVNEAKCFADGESLALGEDDQKAWPLKKICKGDIDPLDLCLESSEHHCNGTFPLRLIPERTAEVGVLARCTKPFTVGVAIDLRTRKEAHFAFDGQWRQTAALPKALLTGDTPLFPAVSGENAGVELRFNCGDRPWKLPYPNDTVSFPGVAAQATGDPPILVAARAGDLGVVGVLLPDLMTSEKRINACDCNDGRSLLHMLCAIDAPALVRRLIAKPNVSTDLQDADGMTPLCVAAEKGQVEAVDALLAHGVARDLTTTDGKTAFKLALMKGHRDIAQKLVPSDAWRVALPVVGPLSEIFDALDGDKWNAKAREGWLQDGDVRTWTTSSLETAERIAPFSPSAADSVPKVIALNLSDRGGIGGWEVTSRFWSSCARLQGLSKLDLSGNHLAGASLRRICFFLLVALYFPLNALHPYWAASSFADAPLILAGELPNQLGELINLVFFDMSRNALTGPLSIRTERLQIPCSHGHFFA